MPAAAAPWCTAAWFFWPARWPTTSRLAIDGQTRQVLAKIDDMLARAGTDKSRLLTAQIWLRTMDDFAGMNAVWDAWVVPGQAPTRCCGKVELADPGWRVEIVVVAAAA